MKKGSRQQRKITRAYTQRKPNPVEQPIFGQALTMRDLEVLTVLFGFRTVDECAEFILYQAVRDA